MSHTVASFIKTASNKSYQVTTSKPNALLTDLYKSRICYLGETHHCRPVLESQLQILQALKQRIIDDDNQSQQQGKIAIVLEHFNMTQQTLLTRYHTWSPVGSNASKDNNSYTLQQLQNDYDATGNEGFDIQHHYGAILDFAKCNANMFKVFGGFPPRSMAKLFVQSNNIHSDECLWNKVYNLLGISDEEGKNDTKEQMKHEQGMIRDLILNGSVSHYQFFRFLLSDEVTPIAELRKSENTGLYDKYGKIFVAQCFKDTVMAYNVCKLLQSGMYATIVVIAGRGHLDGYHGIPEKVDRVLQTKRIDDDKKEKVLISVAMQNEFDTSPFTLADYVLLLNENELNDFT